MLKEFAVSNKTRFIDNATGRWANKGTWHPTYYKYYRVDGKEYLIVSGMPRVRFQAPGMSFADMVDLQIVPKFVDIKDMEPLENPGTYYMWRKSFV